MLVAHRNSATEGIVISGGVSSEAQPAKSSDGRLLTTAFLESQQRRRSNGRFRSGRNMRIKGKRARELLRLSYLSISSIDELSKLNSPLTKQKSLSRLSSQASVETEPSNTTINKGDDDDDYPRPPSTAPAPPPEHSSDNRIVSRRRTHHIIPGTGSTG